MGQRELSWVISCNHLLGPATEKEVKDGAELANFGLVWPPSDRLPQNAGRPFMLVHICRCCADLYCYCCLREEAQTQT